MNQGKRGRPFLHYGIEHSQFANSRIWGMTAGGRNMDMVEDELWVLLSREALFWRDCESNIS